MAARPLIEALIRHWPAHSITISTQTPTGAQTLRQYFGNSIRHLYLPVDTAGSVSRFLDSLRPQCVILMERELWPELIWQCACRCIPVSLVNARLSDRSARGYRKWPRLMSAVWRNLGLVAAADQPSLDRYQALGVPADRLKLTGNLKFELGEGFGKAAPPDAYANRDIIVAGSTHGAEESQLLPLWSAFVKARPSALLVLVPRHPQRFEEVATALTRHGLNFARHSLGEKPGPDTSVVLGDTMGELMRWYGMAKLAFIGGSLAPVGGHNALEALACGCPVLYGPHTHNFDALFDSIEEKGAGKRIHNAQALLGTAEEWLANPDRLGQRGSLASEFVQSHKGANERTVTALKGFWSLRNPEALCRIDEIDWSGQKIWMDPDLGMTLTPAEFSPPQNAVQAEAQAEAQSLATGSGRGQVHVLRLARHRALLRHYRRGGLVARISKDVFWRTSEANSRAMREFSLLRLMRSWGIDVPRPLASLHAPTGLLGYRSDIMVEYLPGTDNLADLLQLRNLTEGEWRSVGNAIRVLHDHQVFHSDLNCHNIMLDATGKVWIVDFDKCEVRAGVDWKEQNLARLLRSLRKEQQRMATFHWSGETGWRQLLDGYAND